MELDMPTERRDAFDGAAHQAEIGCATKVAEKIEPDAAHARARELPQLLVRRATVQQRDATITSAAPLQRVEHGAIVGAVTGGLHQHRPFDAKPGMQSREVFFWCVFWRIAPISDIGEARGRAEDVDVGVAAQRWELECRRARDVFALSRAGW